MELDRLYQSQKRKQHARFDILPEAACQLIYHCTDPFILTQRGTRINLRQDARFSRRPRLKMETITLYIGGFFFCGWSFCYPRHSLFYKGERFQSPPNVFFLITKTSFFFLSPSSISLLLLLELIGLAPVFSDV